MSERCPHCGALLPDTADVFCPSCREALDGPPGVRMGVDDTDQGEIAGLEGLTNEEILWELQNGGRFVVYQYCVSFVVLTLYRTSQVHFIRSNESAVLRGMKYTLLSLAAGWWGIRSGRFLRSRRRCESRRRTQYYADGGDDGRACRVDQLVKI